MPTITDPVTSVTPCPAWCPDAGHHEWTARPDHSAEPERWHTATVLEFVDDDGAAHPRVTAEQYETAGYSQTTVELFNGHAQLLDWGEVTDLVDAIKRAADIAFGPALGLNNPETPAAERAVLHAVQEMAAGRVGQNAVIEAWERLTVARAREAMDMDAEEKAEATR